MFLIVGLGNPGKQYQNTWHNLGFLVVGEFAKTHVFSDWRRDRKSRALVAENSSLKVVLAKPQTFMNDSGQSVKSLLQQYLPTPAIAELGKRLIVVHDDADLTTGTIRVSQNRGAGGHKGVESIIKELKTKNFTRLRIGCRPKNYVPGSKTLDRFVLKKFTKSEEKIVAEVIGKTTEAIGMVIKNESAQAMDQFN